MRVASVLTMATFLGSALSIDVKDTATAGGGTPNSPGCFRQCLVTLVPSDGASKQLTQGFAGSCREYARREVPGGSLSVDGGKLSMNGVNNILVVDFVKNGRDRRASFTDCKNAVFTGAQCSLKQGGCTFQGQSG